MDLSPLKRFLAVVVIIAAMMAPAPAKAGWPVFDEINFTALMETKAQIMQEVKYAIEQVKLLTDSLNFLKDISGAINDVFDAIGEITTIKLPITSLPSLKRQAIANWQCLTNFGKLAPTLAFEDIDFGSLCDARAAVAASMFTSKAQMKGKPMAEQNAMRDEVIERRVGTHANAAVEAYATALSAQAKTFQDMTTAFDQLQSSADAAKTVNARLAVIAQIELARYQGDINLYALQVAALRLQAAQALREVPVSATLPADEEAEK
jgi:hypothetical protein